MKIAITGHTKGIGKALYDGFKAQGHEVIGFNRSTVANISTDAGLNKIAEESKDCDIFINNAYDTSRLRTCMAFSQTVLLYKMWEMWQGQNKKIVCIGSRTSDNYHTTVWPYAIHKRALDEAVKQLRGLDDARPHILNLKPGYVDTEQVSYVKNAVKIDPSYVFEICNWAISQPHLIFDLSFGPKQG
jgi:NAD(P)-dependent dehydrogenase (short-subunit alcohol dehydrogenase family)